MIPVDMIVKHDPANGVYGDCFRCCVASILEMKAEDVPHFMQLGEASADFWYKDLNAWLKKEKQLSYLEIQSHTDHWLEWNAYEEAGFSPYYILSGRSPRDEHSTVGRLGKVVHDPHPARTGLIGPSRYGLYCLGFFIKF